MVPILGQPVFYHTALIEKGDVFPAIVTVVGQETVSLTVFPGFALPELRSGVPHGRRPEGGGGFWTVGERPLRLADVAPDISPAEPVECDEEVAQTPPDDAEPDQVAPGEVGGDDPAEPVEPPAAG